MSCRVRVGEELADAARVGRIHLVADAEDRFVPADAGVDIGDGDRDVMQLWLGKGGHGIPVRLRQGWRAGQAAAMRSA